MFFVKLDGFVDFRGEVHSVDGNEDGPTRLRRVGAPVRTVERKTVAVLLVATIPPQSI